MSDGTEDLLTIPEAAVLIGVSERTLYRLLKSDNFAARTVTEHRRTVTGRRLTTLLPPDLVSEIAQSQPPMASETLPNADAPLGRGADEGAIADNAANNAANADENAGGTVLDGDSDDTDTVGGGRDGEPGQLPAIVYQARIVDLEAMNAELRADKERLYRLLEMAQANLAREQTLRALPAPPPEAPEGMDAGEAAQDRAEGVETPTAPKKPIGWWGRFLGQKE